MTCIVGLVHEGVVYIGGDSAGVGGMSLTVRADEKVFRNGEFLMALGSRRSTSGTLCGSDVLHRTVLRASCASSPRCGLH